MRLVRSTHKFQEVNFLDHVFYLPRSQARAWAGRKEPVTHCLRMLSSNFWEHLVVDKMLGMFQVLVHIVTINC